MTTTTYPDGTALVSSALTIDEVNRLYQALTCQMLGIDPVSDPLAFSKVRLDWQRKGQPAYGINDNVTFLRLTEEDDEYDRIRDVSYVTNEDTSVSKVVTFTRVWRCSWSCYGPASFDAARLLRSGLLEVDFVHDILATSNLYLLTDIAASVRAPEEEDGQTWERTDIYAKFNEGVVETLGPVATIASVEVLLYDESGLEADLQIAI